MWQVSGRSDITDFEEIVRLDTEYISEWNIGLDIKILFNVNEETIKQYIQNQEFSNYFRKLKPEEYELVAKSVLDYIIMMGGFGKR